MAVDPADNKTQPITGSIERLCADETNAWFRSRSLADGIELGQARITERGFDPHRHDTYAIGITDSGAQVFGYRGRTEVSTPGQVIVLHPDELHDGRAGDDGGLQYRIVYVPKAGTPSS